MYRWQPTRSAHRSSIAALVVVLISTTLLPAMAFSSQADDGCRAVRAALALRESLPVNYDEMLVEPPELRRLIFAELDAETQSAIWRQRHDRFLARSGASLDPEQAAVVHLAIALASPHAFRDAAGTAAPRVRERHDELLRRAQAVFSHEHVTRWLFTLEPLVGLDGEVEDQPVVGDVQRPALRIPTCNCVYHADCRGPWGEPGGSHCLRGNFFCVPPATGCGPHWTSGCDGLCG